MSPLDLVALIPLTQRTSGRAEIVIGLIDGPVALDHPDLAGATIRGISDPFSGECSLRESVACRHGTAVAGVLSARRDSTAPGICPDCVLLISPIFAETRPTGEDAPHASFEELAEAIVTCVQAGANVLNLSAFVPSSSGGESLVTEALDHAAHRGVITVAAAGNQGSVGSSVITRHPGVIPVAACDLQSRPLGESNLGASIGRRGLLAPGEGIAGLSSNGEVLAFGGTSAAVPFVTGTVALLWSEFPGASAAEIKYAVTHPGAARRHAIVPPLLNATSAHALLTETYPGKS
jgi:subtilisin family serine protease